MVHGVHVSEDGARSNGDENKEIYNKLTVRKL